MVTPPTLLIGDSTIRDVESVDKDGLEVNINGGAKTGHIKNLLAKMDEHSYGDIIVHVGTNDCSTKYPLENIMDNMAAIVDLAKHVSVTGHVTLSGACPRTDKPPAADKGVLFNEKVKQLAEDTGCVYVPHTDNFTCKNGEVNDELLLIDGLHLSALGTQRLLKNLKIDGKATCKRSKREQSAPAQYNTAWTQSSRRRDSDVRAPQSRFTGHRAAGTANATAGAPRRHDSGAGRAGHTGAHFYPGRSTHTNNVSPSRPHGSQRDYRGTSYDYCDFCGETNHVTSSCKYKQPIKCYDCSKYGHKSKFCHEYRH